MSLQARYLLIDTGPTFSDGLDAGVVHLWWLPLEVLAGEALPADVGVRLTVVTVGALGVLLARHRLGGRRQA